MLIETDILKFKKYSIVQLICNYNQLKYVITKLV